VPLADRIIFQMDQAAPSHQSVLWHQRERSEDSDLNRSLDLCAGGYHPETAWAGEESLPNSTDSQHHDARKSTHFTGVRSIRLPIGLTR
jgi:hypothetical protein